MTSLAQRRTLSGSERRSLLVGLVVGVPLSALFLFLAARNVELAAVRVALGDADAPGVAGGVLAMGGVYLLQARRWQRIAAVPRPAYTTYLEMVVSAVACNNVLPGRLGDLFRARWLGARGAIPGGRAFATVLLDRGADLLALIAFLAASLWFVETATWIRGIAGGSMVIAGALLLVLGFSRAYTRRRSRERLLRRGRVRRIARDTVEGLAVRVTVRGGALAAALSAGAWLCYAVGAWSVATALDIRLAPAELIFLTAVVNLGIAIPSSPGFIGTYQWLAVSTLSLYGVDREAGLAFGILVHAVWFVPTTAVGGGMLAWRGVRRLRSGAHQPEAGEESGNRLTDRPRP